MKVEDNNALRFLLQDEIYLLNDDKAQYANPTISSPIIETPKPVFNYLGSNKKNFLVLVNYADHDFMKDDHLAALESVLTRLDHTREDVAILNTSKHGWADQQQLLAHFTPEKMVMLGQQALPNGIDKLDLNRTQKIGNTILLYTFSFDEMMTNVENKKAFWEQMKNL